MKGIWHLTKYKNKIKKHSKKTKMLLKAIILKLESISFFFLLLLSHLKKSWYLTKYIYIKKTKQKDIVVCGGLFGAWEVPTPLRRHVWHLLT